MAGTRWSVTNRDVLKTNKAVRKSSKGFTQVKSIEEILDNWGEKEDFKLVKITFGRSNAIEMKLYNSGPYLSYRKKINPNVEVIEGKYIIDVIRMSLGESHGQIMSSIDNLKKLQFVVTKIDRGIKWLSREEMLNTFKEIENMIILADEYKVLDELSMDIEAW